MAREHIVSIRLSDDERSRLRAIARGRTVSNVVRGLIRSQFADPLPFGETVGYTPLDTIWFDGSVGRNWPALETA